MIQVVPIGYTIYDSRGSTTLRGRIGERFFGENGENGEKGGDDMGADLRAASGEALLQP